MEQNILIAVGVFSIICVICVAAIGLSMVKQNEKLKEKIRNEKKPMYNVWLSALSNNLPYLFDNQHGKETKGKKCPFDWDLYHLDFVKEARIVENEKLGNEIKRLKVEVEEYCKAARYWKFQYDLKPTENDVSLAFQKQQFEAKEKMYVEKIRQLEKILADTEKMRTEAYALIANVYEFEQTIMPEYGRYNAGAIDISELRKELESTFREYFRREKKIKEKSK